MYHIKEDKRCIGSVVKIRNALMEIMKMKAYSDITVSDLQHQSGVSRSTFYRLFDTVDDVVEYYIDERLKQYRYLYGSMNYSQFLREYMRRLMMIAEDVRNIVLAGRGDIILRTVRADLGQIHFRNISQPELKYILGIYAGACLGLLVVRHEEGRSETADELSALLEKYLNMEDLFENLGKEEILQNIDS